MRKLVCIAFCFVLNFEMNFVFSQEDSLTIKIISCEVDVDSICNAAEVEPMFPGGPSAMSTFILENLVMPSDYNQNEFTGTIYVQFVVEKDGSLTDLKIIKGGSQSLDKEALRVVSIMPNWIPGMDAGKIVRVRYVIPICVFIR